LVIFCLVLTGCIAHQGQLTSIRRLSLYEKEKALYKLESEYRHSPRDWKAYFIGELNADEQRFEEMNSWFDKSLALSSRFEEKIASRRARAWKRYAAAGDSLFLIGDLASARESYQVALVIEPSRHETTARLLESDILLNGPTLESVAALQRSGSTGAAYRWLNDEMRKPGPTGSEVYRRLDQQMSRGKTNPDVAFILGELARQRADYPRMVHWYEQALESGHESQHSMQNVRRVLSERFLDQANRIYEAGEYAQALALLDTTDILLPSRPRSMAARDAINSIVANHSRGRLHRLLAGENVDEEWLKIIMVDLFRQERWYDASRVAERILVDNPRSQPAHLVLYRYHLESGNRESAIDQLETISADGVHDPLLIFNLGILYVETSQHEKAVASFNRAMALGADHRQCMNQLILLAFYRGDFAHMKYMALNFVSRYPSDLDGWRMLSVAAQMNNDRELADTCRTRLGEMQ